MRAKSEALARFVQPQNRAQDCKINDAGRELDLRIDLPAAFFSVRQ